MPKQQLILQPKYKHFVDRKRNVIFSRGISDVLLVCLLCSNKATIEVPCPIKEWARVKVKCKRLVISYTRPLSTAIIARRTFLLFSVQSYCSFPPPPRSPSRTLAKCPMRLFSGGEIFNPTFPEEKSLFVTLVSIKLVTFVAIYPKRFVSIVVYQSLQQTGAAPCGDLDVLMFTSD